MPKPIELTLSANERRELERLRDTSPKPYLRERTSALLKIAAGHSGREVALDLGMRPRQADTIYSWVHRYRLDGVAGLLIQPGRGRKPAFSPAASDCGRGARGLAADGA
jgi:hypothetical protein